MPPELLTTGEFDRRMTSLETMIARGFEQNADKLDDHAQRIAALETSKKTTRSTAGWSTAVAGGVMAAFEAIRLVFGR